MKGLMLILVSVLALTISGFSQTAPDAPELSRLLNEFLAGASRNDAAIHDRFWADDLIYTRSAGVRINKEELMKGVRSAPARKDGDPVTGYSAENVRIQQYGDAAIVAFKLVIATTSADGAKTVSYNLNTGTFIKRNGRWQAVAWQSTVIPPPPSTGTQPAANASATPSVPATVKATPGARVYLKGPRGGCYYVNSSGTKVYVDRKYCP